MAASDDEIVIITFFSLTLVAFTILTAFVYIKFKNYNTSYKPWRDTLLENPNVPPKRFLRYIALMNREQILDKGKYLNTANPSTM
jgi:hypothetical protein